MSDDKNRIINECLISIRDRAGREYVEKLYYLICPSIRHIALKYLCDQHLSDDLVQDFWADIYRIADGFKIFSNGRAYLCRVAANMAINKCREYGRKGERVFYVDYSEIQLSGDGKDIELVLSVETAMKNLDETERIIIQSTYFEEKTVREIAAELKISKSQVDRIKQRALKKLETYLA